MTNFSYKAIQWRLMYIDFSVNEFLLLVILNRMFSATAEALEYKLIFSLRVLKVSNESKLTFLYVILISILLFDKNRRLLLLSASTCTFCSFFRLSFNESMV